MASTIYKKCLRRKDNLEFLSDIDNEGVVYTGNTPKLFPITLTQEEVNKHEKFEGYELINIKLIIE
jgi:hypothetical protein